MARGEVGTLTRGGFGADEEVRIDFTEEIQDAVIMLTGTNNGGNEYSLVVTSVDDTGFTFKLKEWEDEDGPHPATETINWIAVKPGIHELPDGRIIEAGTTTTGTDASPVTEFVPHQPNAFRHGLVWPNAHKRCTKPFMAVSGS